jgi:hypothetical protein
MFVLTGKWHLPPHPPPTTIPEDPLRATDGLAPLIQEVLRKYGGTMKGRGDHRIFDALVRYRAALAAPPVAGAGSLARSLVCAIGEHDKCDGHVPEGHPELCTCRCHEAAPPVAGAEVEAIHERAWSDDYKGHEGDVNGCPECAFNRAALRSAAPALDVERAIAKERHRILAAVTVSRGPNPIYAHVDWDELRDIVNDAALRSVTQHSMLTGWKR